MTHWHEISATNGSSTGKFQEAVTEFRRVALRFRGVLQDTDNAFAYAADRENDDTYRTDYATQFDEQVYNPFQIGQYSTALDGLETYCQEYSVSDISERMESMSIDMWELLNVIISISELLS